MAEEQLTDKVQETIRRGQVGQAQVRSEGWFRDKVKEITAKGKEIGKGSIGTIRRQFSKTNPNQFYRDAETKIPKGQITSGSLFAYWYDPKWAKKLPYYDEFPMIMMVEKAKGGFIGLNFHYLRPMLRARLLDRVKGRGISWEGIKNIDVVKPAVKRYLTNHIGGQVVVIPQDEEELSIFLPLERFKKRTMAEVWRASNKKMR